jgi:hypothetical protein
MVSVCVDKMSVCVDKNWAVPGRFFQSLPLPCGAGDKQGRAAGQGRAGRPGKKTWEILGYGFQDMVFRTWDLNFGAWIFTLAVSETET